VDGETEFREASLMIAQQLQAHAAAKGVTLAQVATAWVLARQSVSRVIAGPRTLAQWEGYCQRWVVFRRLTTRR
jgi:aryl-alcohol dehydrogenase-like predicted oxidoreductase